MNSETILICRSVIFYSENDENSFFEWIKKIECIERIAGLKNELYLHMVCDDLHDHDLRDLLALFYRYRIDMKQLQIFLNPENEKWFKNPQSYWYEKVFGL